MNRLAHFKEISCLFSPNNQDFHLVTFNCKKLLNYIINIRGVIMHSAEETRWYFNIIFLENFNDKIYDQKNSLLFD